MSAVVSTFFFYLSVFNTLAARYAGTCTQGDASRLSGIVYSEITLGIALVTMSMSGRRPLIFYVIVPVLLYWGWQTVFSFHLLFALVWWGAAACDVLEGSFYVQEGRLTLTYPHDGHEIFYAVIWPVVSISMWIGLYLVWSRQNSRPAIKEFDDRH
jgi:hypothetical protein